MPIRKIHHVAYRCVDAKQTVEWYGKHLGMKFVLAIAENEVPSTKTPDPYMHVFLDAGGGNILAFFELPTQAPMGRDPNTPDWVQHLALEVDSVETLLAAKARLEAAGIEVVGPTDHTLFQSIYFFDPNGHRLELAANTATDEMYRLLDEVKWPMLEEWAATRQAPAHARWMHDGSMPPSAKAKST
ncbi:MAG: VOC family protein [Proteobacteria bacterium]|nr:VOC family protein [Pseudomonadota bacterium]